MLLPRNSYDVGTAIISFSFYVFCWMMLFLELFSLKILLKNQYSMLKEKELVIRSKLNKWRVFFLGYKFKVSGEQTRLHFPTSDEIENKWKLFLGLGNILYRIAYKRRKLQLKNWTDEKFN